MTKRLFNRCYSFWEIKIVHNVIMNLLPNLRHVDNLVTISISVLNSFSLILAFSIRLYFFLSPCLFVWTSDSNDNEYLYSLVLLLHYKSCWSWSKLLQSVFFSNFLLIFIVIHCKYLLQDIWTNTNGFQCKFRNRMDEKKTQSPNSLSFEFDWQDLRIKN